MRPPTKLAPQTALYITMSSITSCNYAVLIYLAHQLKHQKKIINFTYMSKPSHKTNTPNLEIASNIQKITSYL
jgi:hypothetical protein